ncbi:MAG: Flp pilus assembly complex ATPase component TadA [Actinomycetota bacterium]|nr:Flp pilus assembly complex ATPase component TadA [Actinomycetota bacterium]
MSRQSVASAASTLEALDGDVRSEVRRRGVDPLTDVDAVRRFARTAVLAHDQLSLSGVVRPVQDAELMVDELVARVAGFGPLQRYLDDPAVEEVWINQPQRVFVARAGKHELTTTILDAVEVRDLVERMLKTSGRRLDLSTPFVDAMLPSGHRLHVVLDGITRGFSAVNIRKFVVRAKRLHDLVELGTLTTQAAAFLDACVVAGLNIIVAGGTQAGKTTMLNTLGSAVPGGERIVSTEEVFELKFDHPDWVPMQTRQAGLEGTGEIKLRHLVKEALRMRPSRIVVGEVRAEECLDLLLALNSGLPGMATLHANSAREALVKMCTLPLLAGENISARFVVPTVASSVDIVVHLGVEVGGGRRVREIVAVTGRVEADVIETEPLFLTSGGRLTRVQGMPPRLDRFVARGIDIHKLLAQHTGMANGARSPAASRFPSTPEQADPQAMAAFDGRRLDQGGSHQSAETSNNFNGYGSSGASPSGSRKSS